MENGENVYMFRNGRLLLLVLVIMAVLSFGYAMFIENLNVRADAVSAVSAVKKHMLLADAVINFKKQYGIYPDEKIYKAWANPDRAKTPEETEARAREIFSAVYNSMPAFRNQDFTLTKNMGFSDGRWIYYIHTGMGRGADVTGLISKKQPGFDYQTGSSSFSELDLLLEYKEAAPRRVRLQCLPLTEYQASVCRQVLNYFRRQRPEDVTFIIPQRRVVVNDIVFQ